MLRRNLLLGALGLLVPVSIEEGIAAPATPIVPMSAFDTDVLVRTVYGEAIGEPERGQIAVAHVVFNRVRSHEALFVRDTSIANACLRHGQFSCWHNPRVRALNISKAPAADLRNLMFLARERYEAGQDYTNGATHYLRSGTHTSWSRRAATVARIGNHVFYKL